MNNIRILVLEDDVQRVLIFEEYLKYKFPKSTIFFADGVDDAKAMFRKKGKFNIYYLDHDLGGKVYIDSKEYNTGYTFAEFLVENGVSGNSEDIIIHSWNSVGADNMARCFKRSTFIPFDAKRILGEIKLLKEGINN